ncbi:tRNA (guanosine(37)-N1)-methyltransferase TrmD [Candidatus Cardinium hertigii]|jgi:tRNA (guanine37-N1)-methyltransferase|uniref:tRNA (guanine-N(1)-)-methyltransferase n=1 Tax=Candidatus Cardinium hertigii TaxID=247481 RepID=A0A3N2QB62_9BACT|nr:tRNA (guanosine(37)-N1)-methyltransferase TrmD [Candidatus Cardinium hertigii]ROT47047.1 tRNA (guanosine(37)-N1)-methyltransferase TrmD [Candidatus Cardinium hertigii]ROT47626.1 tRNA (guanosine(37)-N1)-methyltransferase TrmD [Candidatus Cardinium hertigii]
MRIDIITCLPQLFESPLKHFIFQRAIKQHLLSINIHNLRHYTPYKHDKIDDSLYGGDAGMLLMVEPIANCIRALQKEQNYDEVIYMAPDGEPLTQDLVNKCSLKQNIMVLCGHYKGIDERIRKHFITLEISIGDYVLSGGELPALILADAIVRVIPGVISDASSVLADSFQDGLVAPPAYTRPYNYEGMMVPDVLLSGNHKAIQEWAQQEKVARTKKRRPHLIEKKEVI